MNRKTVKYIYDEIIPAAIIIIIVGAIVFAYLKM